MRIITVNMNPLHVRAIETLMELGIYTGRSEAIRAAIHQLIKDATPVEPITIGATYVPPAGMKSALAHAIQDVIRGDT